MATFNGEKRVIEQLKSLARQTLMPVELIVTDEGSTDQTVDFILKFADQLKFPVQGVQNDVRLEYGRNFLKAASLSKSEYVIFFDQDDIWHPEKIALVRSQRFSWPHPGNSSGSCNGCRKSVSKITDAFKSWLPCGST
jgi:glycosyltransferase involved in cell wall biosynthesis